MLFSSRSVVVVDPSNTFGELAIPLQINQYKSFTHINIEKIAYTLQIQNSMTQWLSHRLVGW